MSTSKGLITGILACLILVSCNGNRSLKEAAKLNQYMVAGMQLYRQHCANCHQVDGTGLARLIPPLKGSDYLESLNPADLACQIRYGLEKEIEVNGIKFNEKMPGIPKLTPLEIAEIITYVKNTWGDQPGLYDVKSTERALNGCKNLQ
jgi:mono/diheme cytochrome c family protein